MVSVLISLELSWESVKIILVLKKQKISLIFLGKIFLLQILVWKILVSKNYKTEEVVQSIRKCSRIEQHLRNNNKNKKGQTTKDDRIFGFVNRVDDVNWPP